MPFYWSEQKKLKKVSEILNLSEISEINVAVARKMEGNLKLMPRLEDDIPGPAGYYGTDRLRKSYG